MRSRLALFAKISAGPRAARHHRRRRPAERRAEKRQEFSRRRCLARRLLADMRVDIGAIEGLLSSAPSVQSISLSDRDGVFATIDHVTMDWSRLALLALTADIEKLEIGAIDVRRKPAPSSKKAQASGGGAVDLPLRVKLRDFRLGKLTLGAPVLGVAAELSAAASAEVGGLADGRKTCFRRAPQRRAGQYAAKLDLAPGPGALKLSVKLSEPRAG